MTQIKIMTKTLKVIEPFFNVELDDIFELTEDGNYSVERTEEYHKHSAFGDEFQSSFNATLTISPDYAQQLINDGYLEEVKDEDEKPEFINVFDEINNLIDEYSTKLANIDQDLPECLKVEQATVFKNLITVLTHLKSLKK